MELKQMELGNLVIDPNIQVREVSPQIVHDYAQAMMTGDQFPPMLVEAMTNRIVCGHHRYYAYRRIYEPDKMVNCEVREFNDDAVIIRTAARDNSIQGRRLSTWDRKRVVNRLRQLGDSADDIARLLSVPVFKIDRWAEQTVIVIGRKGKHTTRREEPVKRGQEHMRGKEVTEQQYEAHRKQDLGIGSYRLMSILLERVNGGWIDMNNGKTMEMVEELHSALEGLLEMSKEKVMA